MRDGGVTTLQMKAKSATSLFTGKEVIDLTETRLKRLWLHRAIARLAKTRSRETSLMSVCFSVELTAAKLAQPFPASTVASVRGRGARTALAFKVASLFAAVIVTHNVSTFLRERWVAA